LSKDYRHYAAQCLALAQAAKDAYARVHLLQMAERWRLMAVKVGSGELKEPIDAGKKNPHPPERVSGS
jgi:hypothetical protein